MSVNIQDLINYRLSRAGESIKEAEAMLANNFYNAAVNRIYYACYYAVNAILLKNSITAKTHKGIRQMFAVHYIQTGLISKEMGRFFTTLYDNRQTGDYDDFILYDLETVELMLPKAKAFINTIVELLEEK